MIAHTHGSAYRYWLGRVTLGEFLGFLIPSAVGVATVAADFTQVAQMFALVLAGMGEGTVLGYFQANALSAYVPKFPKRDWVRATMLGAGAAWFLGMLPSTLGERLSSVPLWLLIPVAAVLGAVLLTTIGYAQYVVLRKFVKHASKWIWVNVVAWLAGLTVVFGVIFAAPEGTVATILFSALGGLGMALTMAVVTGVYARKIMEHKEL